MNIQRFLFFFVTLLLATASNCFAQPVVTEVKLNTSLKQDEMKFINTSQAYRFNFTLDTKDLNISIVLVNLTSTNANLDNNITKIFIANTNNTNASAIFAADNATKSLNWTNTSSGYLNGTFWFSFDFNVDDSYEGYFNITIYALDQSGNWYNVSTTQFFADNSTPAVMIRYINDKQSGGWTNETTLRINFTVKDDYQGFSWNLSLFDSSWNLIKNWTGNGENDTEVSYTVSGEGVYFVNLSASDPSGKFNLTTFNITVDITAPAITLLGRLAVNQTWINNATPPFRFNATDKLSPNMSCTLRIFKCNATDCVSILNQTNSSVLNSTNTTLTNSTLILNETDYWKARNIYTWFIECTDLAGNANKTENLTFYLDTISPSFTALPSSSSIKENYKISVYDPAYISVEVNESNVAFVGLDIIDLNESSNEGVVYIRNKPITGSYLGEPWITTKVYTGAWNSEIFVLTNGSANATKITLELDNYRVKGWLNQSILAYAYFDPSTYALVSINSTDGKHNIPAASVAGNFTPIYLNSSYGEVNGTLLNISSYSDFKLVKILGNESHEYAARIFVRDKALNSNISEMVKKLYIDTTPQENVFVSGFVYDMETGELVNLSQGNVTVYAVEMKPRGMPGVEQGIVWRNFFALNESGRFSIPLNRSGRVDWGYQLYAVQRNASGSVIKISPTLPPLPGFMNTSNVTLYLVPAATLWLRAINASGNYTDYLYGVIMDNATGIPLKFFQNVSREGINISLPLNRSYIITYWREPPANLINETNLPSPPKTRAVTPVTMGSVTEVKLNVSWQWVTINGTILNSTPVNFTTLETYLVVGNNIVSSDAKLPWFANFPGNDTLDSNGYYKKHVMSGSDYLLIAYARNSTHWFAGFLLVRNVSKNITQNITLYPMAGNASSGWNATVFNFFANLTLPNGSAVLHAVEGSDVEIELMDYPVNATKNETIRFICKSKSASNVSAPLLRDKNIKVLVFNHRYAPIKKKYAAPINKRAYNIILRKFEIKPPKKEERLPFTLKFLRYSEACNKPNVNSSCVIFSTDSGKEKFDPIKAAMQGRVNIRMELSSGVVLQFIGVDLIASGPPSAEISPQEIADLSSSTSFGKIWKLGSMAPEIYDYALVGIPYSDTQLNENKEVRIQIPYIYDDNWNVIWNISANHTTQLPQEYKNENCSRDLCYPIEYFTTGVTCYDGEYSFNYWCWMDKANNMIYFKIPHFSGISPLTNGTRWLQLNEACTSDEQCLSGNCLFGLCKPSDWECYADGHCPNGYCYNHKCYQYSAAAPAKIIPKVAHIWAEMLPGVEHVMSIGKSGIAMKRIEIKVKSRAADVKITVTKLDAKPATIEQEVKGKVYQYLEITASNINESNIESAVIEFEVNKSWIEENNIEPATIKLYRYTTTWEALTTNLVNESADGYVYEAVTPGFSTFAISGEIRTVVTTTTTTTLTTTTTVTSTTVTTTTLPSTTTTLPEEAVRGDYTLIAWLCAACAIVFAAACWKRRKIANALRKLKKR